VLLVSKTWFAGPACVARGRGSGDAQPVPAQLDIPTLEEIVGDLRVLRERGLIRVRHSDLGKLRHAASRTAILAAADGGPGAVEALLRAAVDNLGGGSLGDAASHTFGLARGARDQAAQDRRRWAAQVYGVSVERFRKHHERVVLEQVAEEILKLCQARDTLGARPGGTPTELGREISLDGQARDARFPIIIHIEPVELLRGVDIVVVPENVYLEMPQPFKSSVSAAVRRAAARRSPDGEIVADVTYEELRSWVRRNGRPGLPVAAGTVAATSSGELAGQGVRRIYHAAIASPRPGTNDYDVEPTAIAQAVRNALALARSERHQFSAPLSSIGFPLLGAGRGGLNPSISFTWLWAALEREIGEDNQWGIHFLTRRRLTADIIISGLTEAGAVSRPPGWPGPQGGGR
jgi:O-acetyl-ADP-ribose deacetylase (regulator of RNase III)